MRRVGWIASVLILVPIVLIAVANIVATLASCTYDDLPNTWTCVREWATPIMYDFDLVVFLFAYPILGVGLITGFFWLTGWVLKKNNS